MSNNSCFLYCFSTGLDSITASIRAFNPFKRSASAKADLQPYTKEILHEIGKALNDVPNKISLSGHTDSAPYGMGEKGYSNWELSADRANASRRELVYGGMDESKVLRIVGLSSS